MAYKKVWKQIWAYKNIIGDRVDAGKPEYGQRVCQASVIIYFGKEGEKYKVGPANGKLAIFCQMQSTWLYFFSVHIPIKWLSNSFTF